MAERVLADYDVTDMFRPRVKRSVIWKFPLADLRRLVKKSDSLTAILKNIGLRNVGGNASTLRRRLVAEQIDYAHIPTGRGSNRGRHFNGTSIPLSEVMVENSTYNRGHLKRRLIDGGFLENRCATCGLEPMWQDRPLTLVLDHINGVSNDNRRENLQLLCPNCNSQTATFCGRNC